jgi:hypothetical protein
MTDKEIADGADATILTELDEAAEARIIDVLAKVFATNRYPELRAAIVTGIQRHQMEQARIAQEMQAKQQAFDFNKIAAQQNAYQQYAEKELDKRRMEQANKWGQQMANNPLKDSKFW